jgi:uncharacterized membrane protein
MSEEFIHPNWHVILIHYPLGLLTAGLVVELLSLIWPRGGMRAAGRWMILLGSLLSIPALTAGIYAFRDTVVPGPVEPDFKWYDIVRQSRWTPMQWQFITRHIWLNSSAVVLFVLVTVFWMASSDVWRRKLYWPLLILLIIGVGLMGAGAWHGGEVVYRYGTAVELEGGGTGQSAESTAQAPPATQEHTPGAAQPGAGHEERVAPQPTLLEYFLSPLQLHIVLAGLAVACSIGALGLTLRRWGEPAKARGRSGSLANDPLPEQKHPEERSLGPSGAERSAGRMPHPQRFWVIASGVAILTALAGFWAAMGAFSASAIKTDFLELRNREHLRLLWHVIFGISIIILPLILALLARAARPLRALSGILLVALFCAVALQIWLGILILYDSPEGSLTGFNPASVAQPAPAGPAQLSAATSPTPQRSP